MKFISTFPVLPQIKLKLTSAHKLSLVLFPPRIILRLGCWVCWEMVTRAKFSSCLIKHNAMDTHGNGSLASRYPWREGGVGLRAGLYVAANRTLSISARNLTPAARSVVAIHYTGILTVKWRGVTRSYRQSSLGRQPYGTRLAWLITSTFIF